MSALQPSAPSSVIQPGDAVSQSEFHIADRAAAFERQRGKDDRRGEDSESSDGDEDEDEDDDGWEDWVEDGDSGDSLDASSSAAATGAGAAGRTKSLFSDTHLNSPEEALESDRREFGVDIVGLVATLGGSSGIATVEPVLQGGPCIHRRGESSAELTCLLPRLRVTILRLPSSHSLRLPLCTCSDV